MSGPIKPREPMDDAEVLGLAIIVVGLLVTFGLAFAAYQIGYWRGVKRGRPVVEERVRSIEIHKIETPGLYQISGT